MTDFTVRKSMEDPSVPQNLGLEDHIPVPSARGRGDDVLVEWKGNEYYDYK